MSNRKLFWHEGPKQDRDIWNGKLNHARLANNEQSKRTEVVQEFHPNGRRNHAFTPNTDEPTNPAPALDAWQEIVDRYRSQRITPGQKATLDAEYNRGIAIGKSWREIGACTRSDREGVAARTVGGHLNAATGHAG